MDGRRQHVCVHTAVFEPEADRSFSLIIGFNAIMPVGTASVSLSGTVLAANAAVGNLLKEKTHTVLINPLPCLFSYFT